MILKMISYVSRAFRCTPPGKAGWRHWARRLPMVSFFGTTWYFALFWRTWQKTLQDIQNPISLRQQFTEVFDLKVSESVPLGRTWCIRKTTSHADSRTSDVTNWPALLTCCLIYIIKFTPRKPQQVKTGVGSVWPIQHCWALIPIIPDCCPGWMGKMGVEVQQHDTATSSPLKS